MITVFSIISSSGTGRYTAHLVGELAKYHPVTLIAPPFEDYRDLLGGARLLVMPKIDGIKSRLMRWLLLAYSSFSPIRHFAALRRDSDRLYFANAGHWPQIAVYLLSAKLCGYKTALLIHDVFPHRALFGRRFAGFERRCIGWTYRRADRLIVHHAGAIDDLASLGVPRERVTVIPHGLFDLPDAAIAAPRADAHRGLHLLLFGQIRANKNILAAIAAVQTLRAQGRDIALRICGKASAREANYLAACRAAAARQPEDIVIEEGFVAEADLPVLMSWSDACLLPYGEFHSQSGVAMLALANGKPIIASRSGGLAELMADNVNGIAIRSPDAETIDADAIAEAIRRADDAGPQRLAAMGAQGRERLYATASWPAVGKQHAAMLASLTAPAQA